MQGCVSVCENGEEAAGELSGAAWAANGGDTREFKSWDIANTLRDMGANRPMLLLTLPLREKRLLLFLHLLQGGSFVDTISIKIQDVSTQNFFFSFCSFRCNFVYHFFSVEPPFLSCILDPSLLCFNLSASLFSWYSCRGDYESGGG